MDINDLRVVTTVLSLVLFLGIVVWAWSQAPCRAFDEAAQLPFATPTPPPESAGEKQ
jgi:cytochrome c oxidase cbb3-type subunit 4